MGNKYACIFRELTIVRWLYCDHELLILNMRMIVMAVVMEVAVTNVMLMNGLI